MEEFESQRRSLFGLAYRMLGSAVDAEDIVQEAYLKWRDVAPDRVRSTRAYLTTIVTNLCLDHLRSARVRRESYVGPWLPEPIRSDDPRDVESVSLAFLLLLERLSPLERAVYLLHEAFDYDYAEVAGILGRQEAACRQILHRARANVAADKPRFASSKERHRELLSGFMVACAQGDLDGLKRLLAADVTARSDGGGKAQAATQVVHGPDAVGRLYIGIVRKAPPGCQFEIADLNGWPALIARYDGVALSVVTLELDDRQIYAVRAILNPDKISQL